MIAAAASNTCLKRVQVAGFGRVEAAQVGAVFSLALIAVMRRQPVVFRSALIAFFKKLQVSTCGGNVPGTPP
jgi:hypothetical protein